MNSVATKGVPLSLECEMCSGDDGDKGMCVRMWGHSSEGL